MSNNNKDFILSRYGAVIDKLKNQEELDPIELQIVNMTCDMFSKNTQKSQQTKELTLQEKLKMQLKPKESTIQEKLQKQFKK